MVNDSDAEAYASDSKSPSASSDHSEFLRLRTILSSFRLANFEITVDLRCGRFNLTDEQTFPFSNCLRV